MSDIVVCIHGLDHDACEICKKRDLDIVREESIAANSDFSWRSPVNISDADKEERDTAYDIDIEYDMDDAE